MTLKQTLFDLSSLVTENNIIAGSFYKRGHEDSLSDVGLDIISEDLRFFLTNYYFDGVFYNTNIYFCPPERLLERQEGYDLDSSEFIVFADFQDNPIVIDKDGKVSAAIEAIDYKLISPSLEKLFRIQLEFCRFDIENPNIGPDPEDDFEAYLSFCHEQLHPIFYRKIILDILEDEDITQNYFDFFWS